MLSAVVKNLEYVAKSSAQKGHILFGENVCCINGRSFLVTANFYLEAAANGGKGGIYCHVLNGEGFYDPADSWGQPEVDKVVTVCYCMCTLLSKDLVHGNAFQLKPYLYCSLRECHSAEVWCLSMQ